MVKSVVESSIGVVLDVAKTRIIKVLHVDDDLLFLEVAKQCLESQGKIDVDTAHSVDEALEKLKKTGYDAVVCDYQMPDKDGLELLKELRNKGNTIPFIIFTGKGREEVAVQALNVGADQYVDKRGNSETVYYELAHAIEVVVEQKKVEKALFDERERLETVTRNIGAGLAIISKDYRTLWANDVLKQIFGDVTGKLCYSTYNRRNDICPKCGVQEIFEAGKAKVVHEQVGKDVDGETVWSEITATPVKDRDGNVTAALELVVPITQRKRAEEELRASEEKYRSLFANMLDGFAYCEMIFDGRGKPVDFVYLDVNDAFEKITGLKKEDVIGKKVTDAIPGTEITHPELFEIYGRVASTGKEERFELFFKPLSIWLSVSVYSPKKGYFAAVIENTTKRRKAEEDARARGDELKESEEKYRSLVELAPDGIIVVNIEGIVTSANHSFLELVGFDSEEGIVGKPLTELKTIRAEDLPKFQELFKSLMKSESLAPFELFYFRQDGASRWAEMHLGLLKKNGRTTGMQVIVRDITERKSLEKAIQENQREFEQLFMGNPEAAAYIDPNERILNVNRRFTKLFGYSFDEVKGKFLDDFVVPEDRRKEALMLAQKGRKGHVYHETVRKNKEGSLIPVILSSAPIVLQGQHAGDIVTYKDITERKRMEEALKESEARLSNILENSSDQIFMLDSNCRFLSVNRTAANLFGMSPQEMVGRPISEKFSEEIAAQFSKNIKNVFDTGKSMLIDEKMVVEGRESYNSTSLNPVRDDRGRVIAVTGIVRDITERKRVEEEKSRLLHDLQNRVKELNCLFGMSRLVEESDISLDAVLQGTVDLLPPAMQYPDIACARIVVENQEFLTKNFKETRWKLQADIKVLGKKAGYVEVCYLEEQPTIAEGPFLKEERSLIESIAERLGKTTERTKMGKTLRESEERFRAVFEGANDGILAADTKTKRFAFANPRICEITGYSLEELLKLGVGDINPKKDLPYVIDSFEKQRQGKVALSKNIPVLRKDGGVVYCDVSSKSIRIGSQKYLVGIFRDVTESKKGEEALEESEERLRQLIEYAPDAIYTNDLQGNFLEGNKQAEALTGYKKEELTGKNMLKAGILPEKYAPKVMQDLMKSMQGQRTGPDEYELIKKDGTVVTAEISTFPVKREGKIEVIGIARDTTERKQADKKLKESEEKYKTTFESSMDALMLLDARGFLDCNTSTLRLFGCKTVEEFKKYHPADLSPSAQPDGSPSMEAAMNHIDKGFKTGADSFFWIHKRTDGTTFPADVLLTRMSLSARNVLHATVRDITERKKVEKRLKENSERIEMMNEKLRVVGGLSRHDVNNKLSAVTGYAYLLKKKHADQADIVDGLGKMEQAVKEVGKIFDFARLYEKLGVEELTYVDVEKTLDEAVALFSGLSIKVINGCHGLTVLGDSFLRQLFYNLIDNTRKYGGKATAARVYYEKAELDALRLVYEDDGVGISAENKLKLFTEGFSTGGSTGFGLFLIKKMTDVYGWTIQETGKQRTGAQFTILIPRTDNTGKANYQIQNQQH